MTTVYTAHIRAYGHIGDVGEDLLGIYDTAGAAQLAMNEHCKEHFDHTPDWIFEPHSNQHEANNENVVVLIQPHTFHQN